MNAEKDWPIPEAYVKVAKLGIALGIRDLGQRSECWEHQIDERWHIAFNGRAVETKCSYSDVPVPPRSIYIQYNGWPAGILDLHGGIIAAGEGANEITFIQAVERAEAAVTSRDDQ